LLIALRAPGNERLTPNPPIDRVNLADRMARVYSVAAVLVQVALVWSFDWFPTVDGPAHVHLAYGLAEAMRGDQFYGSFLQMSGGLEPNTLTQSILLALMWIVEPVSAEKLLLSVYFMGFAGSGWYALRAVDEHAVYLTPLLLYLSYSFALVLGFYNFAFSTIIFLLWFGYWWRNREVASWKVATMHGLLAGVAWLTHLFAFVVTLVAIMLTAFPSWVRQSTAPGMGGTPRRTIMALSGMPVIVGSVPAIAATLVFLFTRFASKTREGVGSIGTPDAGRVVDLVLASSLVPHDPAEALPAVVFFGVVVSTLLFLLRSSEARRNAIPFAVCTAGFLLIYLIIPFQLVVRWMPLRFQPFVFVILILWIAALRPRWQDRWFQPLVMTASVSLIMAAGMIRWHLLGDINRAYGEYSATATYIQPSSTLIGLRLHPPVHRDPYPAREDVLIQAGSLIATLRHSVDLKNFQGQVAGHPIQFRAGRGAQAHLGGDARIVAVPPRIDLMAYERSTGEPIDYVILWGHRKWVAASADLASLEADLTEYYRLEFISSPRGLARLFARRPDRHIRDPYQDGR
jgi:hypothetical protein